MLISTWQHLKFIATSVYVFYICLCKIKTHFIGTLINACTNTNMKKVG